MQHWLSYGVDNLLFAMDHAAVYKLQVLLERDIPRICLYNMDDDSQLSSSGC